MRSCVIFHRSTTRTSLIQTSDIVIFGTQSMASLAWYCLSHDSPWQVRAFTLDRAYLRSDRHEGLPVLPFDELASHYAPADTALLIPLGYVDINGVRRDRFEAARAAGYTMATYISSRAITWPDLRIGSNCMIYEGTVVQPFATIGDNTIVRSAVHISHHTTIGSHVFIAAGATFGGNVTIGDQAFIGVGAVLRDGVRIGERCFIGAGAVVVGDTDPDGVYVGNPARKIDKTSIDVTRAG